MNLHTVQSESMTNWQMFKNIVLFDFLRTLDMIRPGWGNPREPEADKVSDECRLHWAMREWRERP